MSNFLDAITLAYPKKELQTAPTGQEALYLDKDDWNDLCQRVTAITNMLSGALQVYKSGDPNTYYAVLAVTGSPNGSITAAKGSLAVDVTTPAFYQNTDGAMAWSAVGGGSSVWISNFLTPVVLSTGSSTVYNDLSIGTLGSVNYLTINCTDGGSSVVTGFAGGTTPGQILIVRVLHGSNSFRYGNHELSAVGNQIETLGWSDWTAQATRTVQFMFDGTYWQMIGNTTTA